jgi:predicted PolB exonuclease-like 3'-5' exonuclease
MQSAINLTGFTVAAQVYDDSRTTKYADFTVAYTNRTGGIVDISLSDTDTANFTPDILKYDVLLTDGSGNKEYYLEGTLFISEGYTA